MVRNRDYVPVNFGDGDEEEGGYRGLQISSQPHDSGSTPKLHEEREEEDDVFKVKILDASGSIYPVNVTEDTTIASLKEKVAVESGTEIERQRFIFLGKVLENHQTIKDVNAKPECTIHLFQRPKEIIPIVPAEGAGGGEEVHTNSNGNGIFAFTVQLPSSSISVDDQTLPLDDAVNGLIMISRLLIFFSLLQEVRALLLLKEYFSAVHRASEDSLCVSRGIILTTFGSANFGLFAGIWGIYGARLRHGQTLRWHLIFLAIAGIILLAGRFFKLFLILSDQTPISCFYSGTCTNYAGGIEHCNDNIAQLAGDLVKVEILSIILASVFCAWGFHTSLRFCYAILLPEDAVQLQAHSVLV